MEIHIIFKKIIIDNNNFSLSQWNLHTIHNICIKGLLAFTYPKSEHSLGFAASPCAWLSRQAVIPLDACCSQLSPALWHAQASPLLPRASGHGALGSASLSIDQAAWGVVSEHQTASHSFITATLLLGLASCSRLLPGSVSAAVHALPRHSLQPSLPRGRLLCDTAPSCVFLLLTAEVTGKSILFRCGCVF